MDNRNTMFETLARNADIIRGVRWVATLDLATRPECRIRDLLEYTPTLEPVAHSIPWHRGPGKIKRHCRCVSAFVLIPFSEIGLAEPPPGTRASMHGQVPANLSYAKWIVMQPAWAIEQAVGVVRARLLIRGGMKFPQLYDLHGEYLLISELRQRFPPAFEAAGFK